jgi:hypothetical protein
VSFITPAGGSVLDGTVGVKVSATDNVGVASVKLYVGYTALVGTDNYAPYEFTLNTRDYGDGEHFLKAYVTDKSGNARLSKVYVTFENPVPIAAGDWRLVVYPIKSDDYTKSVVQKHSGVTAISNFRMPLLAQYPQEDHMLFAHSHETIREGIADMRRSGVPLDYIIYDNERNNYDLSTPASELVDPAQSTNQAMDIIHNAGLKSAISPTRNILKEEMMGVQWNKVDLVVIQMQKVVGTTEFYDLTSRVAQVARPQNPDIVIIVQIAPSLYSNAQIVDSVKKVKPYVDGVQVLWNLENDAVLDDLLSRLGAL